MQRTIYHGSAQIIRTPRFGAGHGYNDFGLGFYCTSNADIAREWAAGRKSNGFVNKYSINDSGLRVIDLGSPEYTVLHWLSVLANYREFDAPSSLLYQAKEYIRGTFAVDYQNCDCIAGPRADNCNFIFAQDFLCARISYRQLRDAVRTAETGRQIVLKSNRAFDRLVFEGYEVAWSRESYPSGASRDLDVMKRAAAGIAKPAGSGDLYITDILENEIKPYDPRLI